MATDDINNPPHVFKHHPHSYYRLQEELSDEIGAVTYDIKATQIFKFSFTFIHPFLSYETRNKGHHLPTASVMIGWVGLG
jgi:hypothetical protein